MIKSEKEPLTGATSEKTGQHIEKQEAKISHHQLIPRKPEPVKEKESKTFSIKNIISEDAEPYGANISSNNIPVQNKEQGLKLELNDNSFSPAWQDFTDEVISDGPRVASMFKSIKPELQNEETILIHLSNSAQRDMFDRNYKQKLTNYIETRFNTKRIDIETVVDLSETNEILYSDEQKYNYLSTKHPIIKEIKKSI